MNEKIDLAGNWKFKTDPINQGKTQSWQLGLKESREVTVPHIWQREEDLLDYTGIAWYEKTVEVDVSNLENQLYLCFDAVDFQSDVWWNGTYLGVHEGGFTPFTFKVDNSILKSTNRISVRVYDPSDNAEIPIGKQGSWYTRVSGIWQSVYLEEKPELYITNAFITPDIDHEKLEVTVRLSGKIKDEIMEYTIRPHSLGEAEWNDGKTFHGYFTNDSVDNENLLSESVHVSSMKQWSPNEPYLYQIEFKMKDSTKAIYATTFGYRKVEQRNGKIFLNNRELYMRGALDQAFYPETIYHAPSIDYIKKEIYLAKEMGFNLLRKHIKVEIPAYLYWADRLGMLIWAEHPNYVKWTTIAQKRFAQGLKEMIERDYNHPSIIIWSVYNEEWGLEWDLEFDTDKQQHVLDLYTKVKEWDNSRLVCDNSGWSHVETDINDYHSYYALPEQTNGWKQELEEKVINHPDKNFVPGRLSRNEPRIISEFGVWGLPNVTKLKDYYKEIGMEPWWFANQGEETHQDDYKKPVTLFENFERFGISKSVGDIENLAKVSQKRMFRSVKSLIEEIRKRPELSGYVVTEFTDVEWETNGWLDFLREPKDGFEKLVNFNGANCVLLDLPRHNFWSFEKVTCGLTIIKEVSDTDLTVKWSLEVDGKPNVLVDTCEVHLMDSFSSLPNLLSFDVPMVADAAFAQLKVEVWSDDKLLAENDEELTFSNKSSVVTNDVRVFVNDLSEKFVNTLTEQGTMIASSLENADVVLTESLTDAVRDFAARGGDVIFLAEAGDSLENKGEFTFRKLDQGESWARASSMNYLDVSAFEGLPVQTEMGWEFENMFPEYVVPFADYKKNNNNKTIHMFGNPNLENQCDIIGGYFQGWLGQNGGTMMKQDYGKGTILITTLKLIEPISVQPMAQVMLFRMIREIANNKVVSGERQ